MKNAMTKTTLREVKGSFSRWIAILAICMLGVGFFCGLKVCKEAFILTGDTFLSKNHFYDFELMSTLGLEDKDVDKFAALDGVATARGSYSTDALFTISADGVSNLPADSQAAESDKDAFAIDEQKGEKVAKFHALIDDMNTPELKAGRLPEAANECVGDLKYFTESDIGKIINITENNDEDTRDLFKYDSYEIVGICDSPLYLNFERGSTSLGNGSVATYLYVPLDGWDSEVYTEIYVTLENGGTIYSDEYKANADAMETPLEDTLSACASSRYDDILEEANEKLDDARDELADAKKELADAESELADGQKKINDGERELATNKKKLEDSAATLKESRKKYEDSLAEFNTQKDEAYAQLDAQKAQIDAMAGAAGGTGASGGAAAGSGSTAGSGAAAAAGSAGAGTGGGASSAAEAAGTSGASAAAAAASAYDQALAQYNQAKAELDAKFAAAEAELASAKAKLESGEKELEQGYQKLADGEKELAESKQKLADGRKELKDGKQQVKDGERELTKAENKLDDIENPKTYVLGRDTNIGYVCFDNDTSIVNSIAKVFPVFFFLVAALVCMTTMTRMIDEQRTQIGVLKALGYSRRRILGKYVFYSASASLIGGVVGFIGGSFLFPNVIWTAYGMMYDFADLIYVVNPLLGALSVLAALICCVGTTIFCCYTELRNVPAELIRPKAPALGKRILLERVPFIWNRLKFLHKVCMRNIFRYKKRFFMMVLGICGCTALLITAMGLSDSIKNIISVQYDEIFHNDFAVTFDRGITEKEEKAFVSDNSDYVDKALFLNTLSVDAHVGDHVKSVNMIVADPSDNVAEFITLKNDDGEIAYPPDGHCVINDNLGTNLGLGVGDTLTVYDSDMNEMDLVIDALCENHVYNYVYITPATYEANWGESEINTAFVIGHHDGDGVLENPHEDGAKLMDAAHVASVSINQDMRDRVTNMMKSLDYIIALVMACAGALAFIVLYNLTNINITERIREIATIKVLGFYPGETNAYVFRENFVLTAISALVGIPAGKYFHKFVMSEIQIDLLSFDVHIEPTSYLIAVALTFLFALIVNFAMYFRLERINMAESLKSIE